MEGVNVSVAITFYTGHVHMWPVGHCLVCSLVQSLSPSVVFDPQFVFKMIFPGTSCMKNRPGGDLKHHQPVPQLVHIVRSIYPVHLH